MKNSIKIYISVLIIAIFSLVIFSFTKTSYAVSNTFSKKQMQDLVVSTALNYYYNRYYSDYEQKSLDEKNTITWRSLRNSPEMVSRINPYMIDCSSFVSIVYLYSIGYDMSDYRANISSSYYYQGVKYNYKDSAESYQNGYYITGHFPSTSFYSTSAERVFRATESNNKIVVGKEYYDDSGSNEFVYYYRTDLKTSASGTTTDIEIEEDEIEEGNSSCNTTMYNESCIKQQNIRNNIINILQPGDILIYRRYTKSTNTSAGHAILYVGDAFKQGDRGFIHSTGGDYDFTKTPVTINEDVYSVRYDTWDNVFEKQLFRDDSNNDVASYAFTIMRPINTYCNGNSCMIEQNLIKSIRYKENFETNLENTVARNDISMMKKEQYQYRGDTYQEALTKNNSVNIDDFVSYRLAITNFSNNSYCESGSTSYTTKDKCEEAGYEWKKTDTAKDYNNLKITWSVPENTEFVSCSNSCTYENNTVSWDNVSLKANATVKTYTYKVKVKSGTQIINDGAVIITPNNNKLKMGTMYLSINPTINSNIDKKILKDNITSIENNLNNKNYASDFDFIKDVYKSSYGIDIDYLSSDNIKNAIFKSDAIHSDYFAKKSPQEIESELDKKINKMSIYGIYGGRMLKYDDDLLRSRILVKNGQQGTLELGDILITYDIKNDHVYTWMFYGYDASNRMIFLRYENYQIMTYSTDNVSVSTKSGWRIYKEIFLYDLFVMLRPSNVATTVIYDYDGSKFIASDTYKNLGKEITIPDKEDSQLKFFDNDKELKTIQISYSFDGWYTDQGYNNKISSSDNLSTIETHKVYFKYKADNIVLPEYEKDNMNFVGWYEDSSLETFVGNPKDEISPENYTSLYAKYEPRTHVIEFKTEDGENIGSQIVNEGDKVNAPKLGNIKIDVWYTDKELTNKYDFNTKVYNDMILYGKVSTSTVKIPNTFSNNSLYLCIVGISFIIMTIVFIYDRKKHV